MKLRHVRVMLLGLVLAYGSMACAPKLIGPTIPSGYFFSLWVSDPQIWLLLPGDILEEQYPSFAELTVQVQNAQGQPADGVPVTFQVEPAWIQDASVIPQRVITRGGVAQAVFQAETTGVVRVMVRVDDTTQETVIAVFPAPDTGSNSDM
jgi:hypothetical protein